MGGLPTIVIVDDAPEVRKLVRSHLRLSERLEVVGEGGNGFDAVSLAEKHRPALLLLDVSMPGMDGLAALPRILERSPDTRVVMYSGFDELGLADETRALGAVDFVEKSAPLDELVDRLTSIALGQPTPTPGDAAGPEELDPLLREHLERFREVFEDAAIGMGTMTLSGRLVRANRVLGNLLARPVASLVGEPYASLTDSGQEVEDALSRLNLGDDVVELEHGVRDRGDEHRFRSLLSPVLDARGRPLYVFLQVQDITRQRVVESELRQTEARFRLLVEAVSDYAIFMLDPDGRIASWNAGAQRSKGYAADEIIGQHFRVFYPPDQQAARHPEHELDLATRDGRYEEEGWRVRKDGSQFWASVTITAMRDESGELVGFAKVTRDTTERREMLERLEEANERLAAAAQQQAQFFAVTAHELRSPVAVLGGSADILVRHHERLSPEEREEIVRGMSTGADQLRRLLTDLLTAARLQADSLKLTFDDIDVTACLEDVVALSRRAHEGAEVVLRSEPGLVVRADRGRLTQMVDNLLTNAVRHGLPPVVVTATGGTPVEITVHDSGNGVPDELQGRLFDRFATSSSGGTGLGLFLVRELARAHGGDASYRPEDRAFVLTLPPVPSAVPE
jgi:PAS domain S-box-containing protein